MVFNLFLNLVLIASEAYKWYSKFREENLGSIINLDRMNFIEKL